MIKLSSISANKTVGLPVKSHLVKNLPVEKTVHRSTQGFQCHQIEANNLSPELRKKRISPPRKYCAHKTHD